MTNKTQMILNEPRPYTSQLLWDQVIIVTDQDGNELSYTNGTPIAIIALHKEGNETKAMNQSRKSFRWDVEITFDNQPEMKNISKTFYNRKDAHNFVNQQLLNNG